MKEIKRLPDAELTVMQEIWNAEETPVPSACVVERMGRTNGWKPTSVLTFLSRLCEKGFLQCEKQGKRNAYTPLITAEAYRQQEGASFLKRLYQGSVRDLVASLSHAGALSAADLDELRAFLDEQGRDT